MCCCVKVGGEQVHMAGPQRGPRISRIGHAIGR
jgi:hypothetical protein